MKKAYIFLFILSLFLPFPVSANNTKVTVEIIHSTDKYEINKSYPVLFKLEVAKNWYIHAATKEEFLIPTEISFQDSEGFKIDNFLFPETRKVKFEYAPNPLDVYTGTFFIRGTVKLENEVPEGLQTITGNLSYQACSAVSCLAPDNIPLEIKLSVVPPGTVTNQINRDIFFLSRRISASDVRYDSGILWAILWIFLGGLALNLTPCVYPLIPITVSYFGGRENKSGSHTIILGLLYVSGLAVTNSILGVTAALTGGMLGALLQYKIVLIIIAIIMFSMGLSFFGLWEIHLPSALTNIASKNFSGYFGTFFMGLTLGIVAAPCLGPFVLGLLTYVGQKGDPFIGFVYFFVLSLGLGLPLCILAVFSSAIDRLPKSGDWMLWVKKVMGWVMISMGYYFLSALIKNPNIYYPVFGVLALTAAIHIGWPDKTDTRHKSYGVMKKIVSVIIILSAGLYILTAIDIKDHVKWVPYNETCFEEAKQNARPVILDVYADWCLPCKHMEKTVFNKPEVVLFSKNFTTLRLDITGKQPEQEKIRKRYNIDGAPTIIFFDKEGNEISELRIEAKISAGDFLLHMKKALEK